VELKKIVFYESESFNPYLNLAMEEKLLDCAKSDTVYFYLWQNKNTVVIGKNQCATDECNLSLMNQDNITLARRSSGGGAVYHDLGNLNFTFILPNKFYDKRRQLEVVQKALSQFNLNSTFSGRNDLLINGYKISGQAYLEKENYSLHHGTLLVDVVIENLGKYLKIDSTKLQKHGVKSHRQRVKNIKNFNDEVTIDSMKKALKKAVCEVYNLPLIEGELINADFQKYGSKEWLYRLSFKGIRLRNRYEYGLIDIHMQVANSIVSNVIVNSDLMDVFLIEEIQKQLEGKEFNESLCDEFTLSDETITKDIKEMIRAKLYLQ
jgi:lipoate-protein ligase A